MIKKVLILFLVILVLGFLVNRFLLSSSSPKNPTVSTPSVSPTIIKFPPPTQEELLKKIKNLFFETNPDIDYAIAVYSLKDETYFGYNDRQPQHAASVPKVLTAVYLLREIESGRIKFSDKLGTYNIEFNLKQMVNQSNTQAWEMIDDFLGIKPQEEFAYSLGLTSVNFEENQMSPQDAVRFFVKLYQGELLEEPYLNKLYSYMQNTETETLITPAVPSSIPFYHKSGLYEGEVHDVAIIDHPKNPFVLAIFTVNQLYPDYEGRAKLIQRVAAEVYNFMTK